MWWLAICPHPGASAISSCPLRSPSESCQAFLLHVRHLLTVVGNCSHQPSLQLPSVTLGRRRHVPGHTVGAHPRPTPPHTESEPVMPPSSRPSAAPRPSSPLPPCAPTHVRGWVPMEVMCKCATSHVGFFSWWGLGLKVHMLVEALLQSHSKSQSTKFFISIHWS